MVDRRWRHRGLFNTKMRDFLFQFRCQKRKKRYYKTKNEAEFWMNNDISIVTLKTHNLCVT